MFLQSFCTDSYCVILSIRNTVGVAVNLLMLRKVLSKSFKSYRSADRTTTTTSHILKRANCTAPILAITATCAFERVMIYFRGCREVDFDYVGTMHRLWLPSRISHPFMS